MHVRSAVVLTILGLVAATGLAAQGRGGQNQPGTTWTEAELRAAAAGTRVGRKLTPRSWPGGARVAVCLSFDTDTEAPLLRDGNTSLTPLSGAGPLTSIGRKITASATRTVAPIRRCLRVVSTGVRRRDGGSRRL